MYLTKLYLSTFVTITLINIIVAIPLNNNNNNNYSIKYHEYLGRKIIWPQIGEYKANETDFIILHNNDIHGRFEETNKYSDRCLNESGKDKCYGGFARTAHVIRTFRNLSSANITPPVLYLFAGDIFTGSTLFSVFKEKISSKFMNLLKPDVATLGNHEFDLGVKKLVKFLASINYPVVVSNLELASEPELAAIKILTNSIVLNVNNTRIGIVGYLTPETLFQSDVGRTWILSEIDSINAEIEILKKEGINIFIGLGHSGFEMDKEIAKNCPEIDLIVGGHTNTFLDNEQPPDIEIPEGPYPFVVEQPNGKKVPVVQAYAFTKYLGLLQVKFDQNGNLLNWFGKPILLDSSIPEETDVLYALKEYVPVLNKLSKVIGNNLRYLNGTKMDCRRGECNLGDLIADSYLYVANKYSNKTWESGIALVGAGGIKNSIKIGNITLQNVLDVLPYNSSLHVKKVTGKELLTALEHSSSFYEAIEDGGYLQYSGVKVVYNMSNPVGRRLINATVRCNECYKVSYAPIELNKIYSVVMSSFLLNGGDQYSWTNIANSNDNNSIKLNQTENSALSEYIMAKSIINQTKEDRQVILL